MKKSIVVASFLAVCNTAGLLQAAPYEITIENRSGTAQRFLLTRTNSAVQKVIEVNTDERDTFYDAGFFFKSVGTRSSNNEDLTFDLTPYTHSVTIVYDGNVLRTPSYFEQTKLQMTAAQKATVQRWANTRAWFSDIWKSIKERFSNMFATSAQPDVKIVNNSTVTISTIYETRSKMLLKHETKMVNIAPGKAARYPFTPQMYAGIYLYTPFNTTSLPDLTINIQNYIQDAAQHRNDQLVIVITDIKNKKPVTDAPIWQKKDNK